MRWLFPAKTITVLISEREYEVLRRRYIEGQTYAEIAQGVDVTTARAKQLERIAVKSLVHSVVTAE